jgi:anthranilate synthase component 1
MDTMETMETLTLDPVALDQISLDQVRALSRDYNLIPVWRELPADLETPVSVYLKLRGEGAAFLLESVKQGEQVGRYSFLGVAPEGLLIARDGQVTLTQGGRTRTLPGADPLDAVRSLLARYRPAPVEALPGFCGGLVGYVGYDAVRFFERAPLAEGAGLGLPDAVLMLADTLVIFDHVKHRLLLVVNAPVDGDVDAAYAAASRKLDALGARLRQPRDPVASAPASAAPPVAAGADWTSNVPQPAFEAAVRRAKEYVAAGDVFQVVLSQRLARPTSAAPFTIYRALRMLNPSPYMFYLELPDDLRLIGSSPEVLVQLEGRRAAVRPIAGTRPRGADAAEDAALAQELLDDPKERAEHVMLVDLGRNDLGRVCRFGSVEVAEMMTLEAYSHVMHIVSQVYGELRPGLDAVDLLRATFPAGTVSGAPKVRAMEIIAELEGVRRGPYAGAVGYFGYGGDMDTCIAIRTIVMQGDVAYVQAGAGIVADSDPTREYHETLNKAQALAQAVERAERWSSFREAAPPSVEKGTCCS